MKDQTRKNRSLIIRYFGRELKQRTTNISSENTPLLELGVAYIVNNEDIIGNNPFYKRLISCC